MSTAHHIIRLNDVAYRYPDASTWAVRNISFDIEEGGIYRLTGRNGAGKSTLLRIIAGITTPTQGLVMREPGVDAVYMTQHAGAMLADNLSVDEQLSVAAPSLLEGATGLRYMESYGLGLERRRRSFVGTLSGGQRQILAMVCATISGARVLCLDEFHSAMDDASVASSVALLKKVVEDRRSTVVFVSHLKVDLNAITLPLTEVEYDG